LLVTNGYNATTSHQEIDSEWDDFLATTPGGHHVQSSLWGRVKASQGWKTKRVLVHEENRLVAGAQMLIRPVPLVGAIGYVTKGPVFGRDDSNLFGLVLDELRGLADASRVKYFILQPPVASQEFDRSLFDGGYRPCSVAVAPVATTLVDLSPDSDAILAGMKSRTRYNIRLGLRKGVTVREGTDEDLQTYYDLLVATSRRKNFTVYPKEYYSRIWSVFTPGEMVKLFVAEFEGEIVSAQLAIAFNDTVTNKLSVWSGKHGKHRPNEVLYWAAMEWAKSAGYRYYDLEGIELRIAQALLETGSVPESLKGPVTDFKLGFGGEIVVLPGSKDYFVNPLMRAAYNGFGRNFLQNRFVSKIIKQIRTN